MSSLFTETTHKQITCVLYNKGGIKVMNALHERGINSVAMYHARGFAIGDQPTKKGLPPYYEKEVLVITIEAEQADEIFEFVFEAAEIDRHYGGFIYMETIRSTTPYVLPDESQLSSSELPLA